MEQNQAVVTPQVLTITSVSVRFLEGNTHKSYDFKTDMELLPNDIVVVETQYNDYSLARVEMMHKHMSGKATKWVIDKVDTAGHEARRALEAAMKETKQAMERRRRAIEDEQVYKKLAEQDPEMKELLERHNQLKQVQVSTGGRNFTAIIPPRGARPTLAGAPILTDEQREAYERQQRVFQDEPRYDHNELDKND